MKILKPNTIQKKIFYLVSLTVLVSLLGTSGLNYYVAKIELNRSNNIILTNAIESALSEINRNYSYTTYENPWMTQEQAKEVSLSSFQYMLTGEFDSTSSATAVVDETSAATENTKYKYHRQDLGEQGYFFVVNSKGDIISHPSLTGNIYDLQASDGRYIVQELISLAKSGGGTLDYALPEDVSVLTDSKTVHAQYFPKWDWVIAAVIFDKDLNRGSNIIAMNSGVAIFIALLLSIGASILFSRRITNPIKAITSTLQKVAEGDLTINKVELSTKDETKLLADSTNRLIDSLKNVVGMMNQASQKLSSFSSKISQSAEIVSESTTQVTTAITQMAEQTEDQYKGTVEGLNKVTLLGEDIKETAEASTRIETVVQQNVELKEEGLTSVHVLMDANNENNANSIEIEKVVNSINAHSQDIGEIIKIIANVAKQTNLLALNASIEASRAGEHGTGFAVVAEEIGKLANETKLATEDVRRKIEDMQKEAEAAANFIGINKQGVEKINSAVNQTESIIGEISTGLQQLIESINLIVDKNFEINKKKDDILVVLHNVSETAENNSASIEELSATAQEQTVTVIEISESMSQLNDMAQELNSLINKFKVD